MITININDLYNSPSRYIKPNVKIYLKDKVLELGIEGSEERLIDFIIDNKSKDDNKVLLGGLGITSVSIMIDNYNKHFTHNNTNSPYIGKLVKNVKVEIFVDILDDNDIWVSTLLGTFYSESWNTKTGKCELIAYDKLWYYTQLETISTPVLYNISVYDLVKLYITNLDSKLIYNIDEDLKLIMLQYGWFKTGVVGTTLVELVKSLGLYVFMTNEGVLRVKNALSNSPKKPMIMDGGVNTLSIDTYQNIKEGYSTLRLNYNLKSLTNEYINILEKKDMGLTAGVNQFNNLKFSREIVTEVLYSELTKNSDSRITDFEFDSNYCDITISSVKSVSSDLKIIGKTVLLEPMSKTFKNQSLVDEIGDVIIETDTYLLSNDDNLNNIASSILHKVSSFNGTIKLKTIGNVGMEIGDKIIVSSKISGITNTKYDIKSITYKYQNGYSMGIVATISKEVR